MDKTAIKLRLVDTCRKKLLENIASLEAAMAEAQQQANEYGPPKDRYDAFRSQLMRRRDMMAQQLDKELLSLKALDRIDASKLMDIAGFGAIVTTPDQNYFISVGIGKIDLPEFPCLAASPMVPICQALMGKKTGDLADFRGTKIRISEVF